MHFELTYPVLHFRTKWLYVHSEMGCTFTAQLDKWGSSSNTIFDAWIESFHSKRFHSRFFLLSTSYIDQKRKTSVLVVRLSLIFCLWCLLSGRSFFISSISYSPKHFFLLEFLSFLGQCGHLLRVSSFHVFSYAFIINLCRHGNNHVICLLN